MCTREREHHSRLFTAHAFLHQPERVQFTIPVSKTFHFARESIQGPKSKCFQINQIHVANCNRYRESSLSEST
jgi:hypothetical protein